MPEDMIEIDVCLPKYVKEKTAQSVGFNYCKPDTTIVENNCIYMVYASLIKRLNFNMVVVEALKYEKSGRQRREWYFDTIECNSKIFLEDVVKRKNRIAGKDLESKILSIIEPLYTCIPSQDRVIFCE